MRRAVVARVLTVLETRQAGGDGNVKPHERLARAEERENW